jgi:hypothetical protein
MEWVIAEADRQMAAIERWVAEGNTEAMERYAAGSTRVFMEDGSVGILDDELREAVTRERLHDAPPVFIGGQAHGLPVPIALYHHHDIAMPLLEPPGYQLARTGAISPADVTAKKETYRRLKIESSVGVHYVVWVLVEQQ